MNLKIGGWNDAMIHNPNKPTYAIRIGNNFPIKLINSSKYIKVHTYNFSDIWPNSPKNPNDIMFNETLAEKILKDFYQNKEQCEALFVHCSKGKNRSPAVGIALNEIFEFGYNTKKLIKQYPESTWYVYDLLIKMAKKLKI